MSAVELQGLKFGQKLVLKVLNCQHCTGIADFDAKIVDRTYHIFLMLVNHFPNAFRSFLGLVS